MPRQRSVSPTLQGIIECLVCWDRPVGRIYGCVSGHVVCEACRGRLAQKCPICKAQLTTRCLRLEELRDHLRTPGSGPAPRSGEGSAEAGPSRPLGASAAHVNPPTANGYGEEREEDSWEGEDDEWGTEEEEEEEEEENTDDEWVGEEENFDEEWMGEEEEEEEEAMGEWAEEEENTDDEGVEEEENTDDECMGEEEEVEEEEAMDEWAEEEDNIDDECVGEEENTDDECMGDE